MAVTLIVTNAGRAALVNASNTGTAPVTIAQVGVSPTAVVPTPAAAALPGETKRIATVSGDVVADDTIHLIVRDEGSDVYTVRSFALYLADGTLFGLYGQPDVILEKSAQAQMLLAIDVKFADIAASEISFGDANFLNPPATTTVQGVVELATEAEAETGVDTVRAVTPKSLKSAVTSWLNARFGEGAPSDFVKTLLTSASAAAMRLALGIKGAALKDEGAGNNLDADLLDGQHGGYYADVPGRLGYVPWGPSNDGAGSGLDAGLFAGQLPSYYTNITQRLGYIPANRGGDTFTGSFGRDGSYYFDLLSGGPLINFDATDYLHYDRAANILRLVINGQNRMILPLTGNADFYSSTGYMFINGNMIWSASNDGSGSGLDADLLDGKDSSWFENIIGRLGYTPANRGGDTFTGGIRRDAQYYLDFLGSDPLLNFDANDYMHFDRANNICKLVIGGQTRWIVGPVGNFDLYCQTGNAFVNGQQVMHWGNDGSGSGYDADLLDGYQGSDYDRIVAQSLVENGGYTVYASGRKECWGVVNIVTEDAYVTVNLPVAHDSWCNPIGAGVALSATAQDNTAVRDVQFDGNGKPISFRIWNAAGTGGGFPFRWRSIGK